MFWIVTQIIAGLLYANVIEWLTHKYILHGIGTDRTSWFSSHWHEHHKTARKNAFKDTDYTKPFWKTKSRLKEVLGLTSMALSHICIAPFFPVFWLTLVFSVLLYYFVHKKSHVNVEWGKKWLSHHYDHHMGLNQNANWGVTHSLFDNILGTRIKYEYDKKNRPKKI